MGNFQFRIISEKLPKPLRKIVEFFRYRKMMLYLMISFIVQVSILLAWKFPPPREEYLDMTDTIHIIEITAPAESAVHIEKELDISEEITDEPEEEHYDPSPITEPTQSDFDLFFPERSLSSLPRALGTPLKPHYPAAARNQQIEGTVIILAFFDKNGTLRKYKVMRGIGYGCNEAAVAAIKAQLFSPGIIDGKPVPARMYVQYTFTLEDF